MKLKVIENLNGLISLGDYEYPSLSQAINWLTQQKPDLDAFMVKSEIHGKVFFIVPMHSRVVNLQQNDPGFHVTIMSLPHLNFVFLAKSKVGVIMKQ